jgi:hypothetical protein
VPTGDIQLARRVLQVATAPGAIEIERSGATVRLRLPDLCLADLVTVGRRLAGLEP